MALLRGSVSLRVVIPVSVPHVDQIDLFENYSYTIEQCAKKIIKKTKQNENHVRNNYTKNVNMNVL